MRMYFLNQWIIFKAEMKVEGGIHSDAAIFVCAGGGWPRGMVHIISLLWGCVVNCNMYHTYKITINTGADWHMISCLSDLITGPLHKALTK